MQTMGRLDGLTVTTNYCGYQITGEVLFTIDANRVYVAWDYNRRFHGGIGPAFPINALKVVSR